MILKKCNKCGALVKVLKDCTCEDCGIKCCGENMKNIVANSVDAAVEKHVPEYVVTGDKIKVQVNHVMEQDHYIEWVSFVYDGAEQTVYFKPDEKPEVTFDYVKGATIYSYCNKHLLWYKIVE